MADPDVELEAATMLYEQAELRFLDLVRASGSRRQLTEAADRVGSAAADWCAAAYKEFSAERTAHGEFERSVVELEIDAERAELLQGLWSDISVAYSDQPS